MKKLFFLISIFLLMLMTNAYATFDSGSTGADGTFDPSQTPPQVPSGTSIDGNNAVVPLPPDGMFNFTTVNIPSGWTITFTPNAANTPVYILATGDVAIAGTIKVDGSAVTAATSTLGAAGGPGGFDGGYGFLGTSYTYGSKGLGPGGGNPGASGCYPGSGGFGTAGAGGTCGATGGPAYGNAELQPVIGGSGGGGYSYGGAGGGGAILIAASGTINMSGGTISADGGNAYYYFSFPDWMYAGAGGSGGGIKLIADTVSGTGYLYARGGSGSKGVGGQGRIRIEANTRTFSFNTNPSFSYAMTGGVLLTNTPSLAITSIGGVSVPASPTGSFATPDIWLPTTTANPVTVALSASFIPVGTTVTVTLIPEYGSPTDVTTALSGTLESSTASVGVNLPTQNYISLIQAQATFSVLTAMYWDGEKIDKVRVASRLGKGSEIVYITESGREVKGALIAGVIK